MLISEVSFSRRGLGGTPQYLVEMSSLSEGYAKANTCEMAFLYDTNYITTAVASEDVASALRVEGIVMALVI